ncbi:MAG: hypothetical protein DCC67_01865 [Planctomycetota bacterium]|nr:MAG: hypothetical protein DCC67_01865 [Planctomycetota bacterium]
MSAVFTKTALGAIALLAAAGCSGKSQSVPVEGTVTFNGKKVVNGDIRLEPEAGTPGVASTAPIVDGKYHIGQKGGVPIGTHRVILRAFIIEGVGAAAEGAAEGDLLAAGGRPQKTSLPVYRFEGREQFLPPEYNARPGLIITVTGEQNPQIEDFNLRGSAS